MTKNFPLDQVLEAIKGSGAVMSTIARRLSCDWTTAARYCDKWAATKVALQNEHEGILDLAESILVKNMQLAFKAQVELGELVDSGDAKWVLSRKGKDRGYSERQEVTGAGGDALVIHLKGNVTPEDF